jgi:hypothetical protein
MESKSYLHQRKPFIARPAEHFPGRPMQKPDEILGTEVIEADRKLFKISLRRNRGGEFFRIEEKRGENRTAVIMDDKYAPALIAALEKLKPELRAVGT